MRVFPFCRGLRMRPGFFGFRSRAWLRFFERRDGFFHRVPQRVAIVLPAPAPAHVLLALVPSFVFGASFLSLSFFGSVLGFSFGACASFGRGSGSGTGSIRAEGSALFGTSM